MAMEKILLARFSYAVACSFVYPIGHINLFISVEMIQCNRDECTELGTTSVPIVTYLLRTMSIIHDSPYSSHIRDSSE